MKEIVIGVKRNQKTKHVCLVCSVKGLKSEKLPIHTQADGEEG